MIPDPSDLTDAELLSHLRELSGSDLDAADYIAEVLSRGIELPAGRYRVAKPVRRRAS